MDEATTSGRGAGDGVAEVAVPRRRILVVEDDAAIRNALAEALDEFDVDVAQDGFEALQAITAAEPDLVVLDLMMPRMSGWQFLEQVRRRPELAELAIIIVTAARYVGSVPSGYPVFVKPLRLESLIRSIHGFLA
jgi:two-component system response regulator MprA